MPALPPPSLSCWLVRQRKSSHRFHDRTLDQNNVPTSQKKLKDIIRTCQKNARKKRRTQKRKKRRNHYDNLPKPEFYEKHKTGETGLPAPGTSPLPTPPPPSDSPPSLGTSKKWRLHTATTTETIGREARDSGCVRLSSPPSKQTNTIGSWKGPPAERGERRRRSDCSGRRHPSTRRATST